jgi:hypothetical protein
MSSYGGYISSLSVWEDRAVLAVKVPQGSMMAFMEDVSRMGRVAGKSISGTDLADRIIDLEARLRGAREAEARLLELLDRARSVDEVLSIMREVSRVRGGDGGDGGPAQEPRDQHIVRGHNDRGLGGAGE